MLKPLKIRYFEYKRPGTFFINKNENNNLRRAIMKRSKLKNKANKTKNPLDIMNYKKQKRQNNIIM